MINTQISLKAVDSKQDQSGLLRLWQPDDPKGWWAWAQIFGAPLGNGERSGWVTFDSEDDTRRTPQQPTGKIFLKQPFAAGAKGHSALELFLPHGWPLNISSDGNGVHNQGRGTGRPNGAVGWKVVAIS